MPSNPSDNNRFLSASVINDPSPRCRIGALNILTAMLSGSRNYLWRADYWSVDLIYFTNFIIMYYYSLVLSSQNVNRFVTVLK